MYKDNILMDKKIMADDFDRMEKISLIEDMSDLLSVMQKKGHKLANETHNETYDLVNELNQHLHQAHLQLRKLRLNLSMEEVDGVNSSHLSGQPASHH